MSAQRPGLLTMASNKTHDDTKQNTKQLPVRLPAETYEALKATAFFTNRSMNEVVTTAVHAYLAEEGRRAQLDAVVGQAQKRYRTVLDKLGDL
jgi:hypothetical protein